MSAATIMVTSAPNTVMMALLVIKTALQQRTKSSKKGGSKGNVGVSKKTVVARTNLVTGSKINKNI